MSNLTPRVNKLESNLIIDGAMEIWLEGTSRTVANNSAAYGSVLLKLNNTASGITLTNSRQTSTPSGSALQFSNQVSKTAAGTLAAGTSVTQQHVIEGYNIQSLLNNEFSIIFWVKSSVASNRTLAIRNETASHSYLKQYTINTANTWELKALRFPNLSSCPGALDSANGAGLRITWNIVSGSTFQNSTLNQWLTGDFVSGIGEDTTWLTGTTHDFNVAGLMLLPGNWEGLNAAQYNFVRAGRNFQEELAMTQRYYLKTFPFDTVPQQNSGVYTGSIWATGQVVNLRFSVNWIYPVTMRAIPNIITYSVNGASANWSTNASVTPIVDVPSQSINRTIIAGTTNVTPGNDYAIHATADARF